MGLGRFHLLMETNTEKPRQKGKKSMECTEQKGILHPLNLKQLRQILDTNQAGLTVTMNWESVYTCSGAAVYTCSGAA